MTTLAADKVRDLLPGDQNDAPVIASDIIYGGAAVGLVKATGYARPLVGGDRFIGFALRQVDNSLGAAGDKTVRVVRSGRALLSVTGALITDVGCHVWASDDDTFGLTGVGGSYIGRITRFTSAGLAQVAFDVDNNNDPFGERLHELKSANYTVDAEDSGKVLWVDTDAVVITLPAVEGISGLIIANAAGYGVSGVAISPNASDMIEGADITAADNKDLINTKATAARQDFAEIDYSDANGWVARRRRGVWAREA
jgi:hypothetical protein